jgi:hypothetical protein
MSCKLVILFFVGYVLVLILNMCLVNTRKKIPHKKFQKTFKFLVFFIQSNTANFFIQKPFVCAELLSVSQI